MRWPLPARVPSPRAHPRRAARRSGPGTAWRLPPHRRWPRAGHRPRRPGPHARRGGERVG